jgi:hypothetical protein
MPRPFAAIVAFVLSLAPVTAQAQAQSYPNHTVKIIIGPSPDIF